MKKETIIFDPKIKIITEIPEIVSIDQLAKEVGIYSATPDFVRKHGGELSKKILDLIPQEFFDDTKNRGFFPNIDIRVHRLYKNDIPAYPGWHCDGEYRETYFSQPEVDKFYSRHIIMILSTHPEGVSNTEFLNSPIQCEIINPSKENPLWKQVHLQIEKNRSQLDFKIIKDGQLIEFDSKSPHRAMESENRGWRLFFRISQWHKPNLLGEQGFISRQEQVYKKFDGDGW